MSLIRLGGYYIESPDIDQRLLIDILASWSAFAFPFIKKLVN